MKDIYGVESVALSTPTCEIGLRILTVPTTKLFLSFPQGTKYSSFFFSKIFSDVYSALCFYFHYFSSDKSQKSQRKLQLQHYIKIQVSNTRKS